MHEPRDIAIVACLIAIARNTRPGVTYEDTGAPVDDVRAAWALLDQSVKEIEVQRRRAAGMGRDRYGSASHTPQP